MPAATLWTAGGLGGAIGGAMLVVGAKLHRRSRLEGQPALASFAAFWIGIGAYAVAEAAWVLAWLAGVTALPLALFVLQLKIVTTTAAFAGLVVYAMALRDVGARARSAILGAYVVVLALVGTHYAWRSPVGVEAADWGLRLVYAQGSAEPWWTILLLVLLLPPIVAAISYAMLLRHAREPEKRRRIALVSASLLLFFVPTLLAWEAGSWAWWGLVEKLLGLAMAAGVVLAMWPPAPRPARRARKAALDEGLAERARLLI